MNSLINVIVWVGNMMTPVKIRGEKLFRTSGTSSISTSKTTTRTWGDASNDLLRSLRAKAIEEWPKCSNREVVDLTTHRFQGDMVNFGGGGV